MNHHAYYLVGRGDEGLEAAYAFAHTLGLSKGDPDIIVLRPALFSVEEARKLSELASRTPSKGDRKIVIALAERIFHEAQNALLKTFEEPVEGTYLVLVVPAEGTLIPTLRSRLLPLPVASVVSSAAAEFWNGTSAARKKIVDELLEDAKSDKAQEKQAARSAVLAFVEGLVKLSHERRREPSIHAWLEDLNRFIPILHERSAPLKLILEHVLLVAPKP